MIMDEDANSARGGGHSAGRVHIALAGIWIARRMVVGEDQGRGAEIERAADDRPRIDRDLADAALRESFVLEQAVACIEEKDAQPLGRQIGHVGEQIGDQRFGTGDHRAGQGLGPQRLPHRLPDRAEQADRALIPKHAPLRRRPGGERRRQRAEFVDQPFGPGPRLSSEGVEEFVQDLSAPKRATLRRWLKVPITIKARIG